MGGSYRNPVYGRHFLDALDLMGRPEVGLIEVLTRGYRFAGGGKQRSTIKPTVTFAGHMPPSLIRWESFDRAEEPEVLILKRPKDDRRGNGETVNYRDTAQTRRRRKEVQRISEVLRNAPLKLVNGDDGGDALCLADDGQPIDPTRRSVRRIFNNGSWYEGGRLFDGFWETMRRDDRFRFLRICTKANPDGEHIANVDFSQLFPTLAYHRLGTAPPDGDLHDIVGDGSSREGWKTLVNAMLFAKGTMRGWPSDASQFFPKGTQFRDALPLVRHVHAPIARLFGAGVGFNLMLIESEILIQALASFAHRGITALPLHDSVLVAKSEAEEARGVMADAFGLYASDARAKLKVTFS